MRRSGAPGRRVAQVAVFLLSLGPAAWLARDAIAGGLGANPIEAITHRTGFWALSFLLATLAVSPWRRLTGQGVVTTYRRMLGLFAFFYASLHFLTYAVDQTYLSGFGVSPVAIMEDVAERPYITVGFTAFVLLIPLAVTSTKGWVRRLGGQRWRRLHRVVYVAAVGGVVHFAWLVKADVRTPLLFAAVAGVLLGERVVRALRGRRAAPSPR